MQPGDLVAIHTNQRAGLERCKQFTADKRQLYAAIERVKWFSQWPLVVGLLRPWKIRPTE